MKVILVNFTSTYHRLVAREIIRKGVEVSRIYCIPDYVDPRGSYSDKENSKKNHYKADPEFEFTEIIDLRDLQYADRVLPLFGSSKSALSEAFLKRMSECEAIFMRHSDRFSFYPVSASLRRRIYHALLCYSLDDLLSSKPDRIIFADSPHVGFDTILYFVAKELGIPTLLVEATHINNASLLIADYRGKPVVPKNFLAQLSFQEITKRFLESPYSHVLDPSAKSRSLESIKSHHSMLEAAENDQSQPTTPILSLVKKGAKKLLGLFGYKRAQRNSYSRALVFNSLKSAPEIEMARHDFNFKKTALRRLYADRADPQPDLNQPYVFFPLHLQPEKTTSAFGEHFEDQYLALKIISQSIPDNYIIYVKEHPAQLVAKRLENMLYRDKEYYDLVCSIPRIVLVGMGTSYRDLMRRSVINATITGSVGWESMLDGKPAMIFGYSWYSECPACFRVTSVADCRAAIAKMIWMSKEEVRLALMKYLLFYDRYLVSFAGNPRYVADFDSPYEQQIKTYAEVVCGLGSSKNPSADLILE